MPQKRILAAIVWQGHEYGSIQWLNENLDRPNSDCPHVPDLVNERMKLPNIHIAFQYVTN